MTQVLISIGSNKQNPQHQIETAFLRLNQRFDNVRMSSLYLTEPVGGIPQDSFINAAIRLDTQVSAHELLQFLMVLEHQAHRNRAQEISNGPRSLDLDIILFGDEILSESDLVIPHPRFRDRRFVLEPMQVIAPEVIDPVSQKSISQLLDECSDRNWVKEMEEEILTQ
ncbi:MAG: 2-amino-4-hydroxy-6-hydroxymethyldihydropteridine diphosphokinase [FCB group bacterium]|nr:2-amino-4-hydroxy-6-hydroxymethyldihydropteridine diphosphokinase [FCB group bacterium]MBL7028532.1 2-amino-4-hydroxy-6-hydroxymethyldihydropteridine diphosphokinase [Candidatus Neomarinimicrobiota bacterium]MBL7121596.1 2-amino-4-hydroxy-6-hydroxymethyldihydropteridine diphosphokinase [Candidatus Neomarinimicrobiota bacterium]